jgi:hypothetical protein
VINLRVRDGHTRPVNLRDPYNQEKQESRASAKPPAGNSKTKSKKK